MDDSREGEATEGMKPQARSSRGSEDGQADVRRLLLLVQISQILVLNARMEDDAMQDVFGRIAATLGYELFFHFQLGDEPRTLRLVASAGLTSAQRDHYATIRFGQYLCGKVAERCEPLIAEDLPRSPYAEAAELCSAGVRSYAGFPLLAQGTLLGTIAFATRHRDHLHEDEIQLIETVCAQAAAQLARARSERRAREREIQLRSSEDFIRRLTDIAPSILYIYDLEERRNVWGNREMLSGLGYTQAAFDAMGEHLLERLMHPDDRAPFHRHAARLRRLADGEAAEFEYRMRCADGSFRWFCSRDMVFRRTEDGRPRQLLGAALDITRRKQVEEALRDADRRKDEFLAMLGHELRNPLSAIRNATALLGLRAPQDPHLARARGMIERQVGHLVRMMDDLLDVSRISQGKLHLQRGTCDLAAVVQQALEGARALIDGRRHELAVHLPAEPILVLGDVTRLTQVVGNLLHNAAKYTDEGGRIWLQVERARAGEGEEAVVRVRDTGRGIEPALLGSIFDLFYQADRSLDRAEGGLGIGLSLVRQLVEMHGGRVEAHSEGRGMGSEFVIRLPCLAAAPAGL